MIRRLTHRTMRGIAIPIASLALSGCAMFGGGGPVDVEILDEGYLVNNTVLASPGELSGYLAGQDVRQVRLIVPKGTPSSRVAATGTAVRDAGATVIGP